MQKSQIYLIFSICFIVILLSITTNIVSITQARLKEEDQGINLNTNFLAYKWDVTEVLSTESTGGSQLPAIAADATGNVYIVWDDNTNYAGSGTDYDIFYKKWNALTSSWTATEVLSTESTAGSISPAIAVDAKGNVHIAWQDSTDYAGAGTDQDIFYKKWNAITSTWTATEVVSTQSTSNSQQPAIAVDTAGNVYITWNDYTDYAGAGTDVDIFYKEWNAATFTWNMTEVVSTESTGDSQQSSLAVDTTGNVYVAWRDFTDYAGAGTDTDIFFKECKAVSSAWTITEVVSTVSTSSSAFPSLAVDEAGNVHIVWQDFTDYAGAGTDCDIFYRKLYPSLSLWTSIEIVSTETTNGAYSPSLSIDSVGNIHVVWFDYTNYAGAGTDSDIFYKRLDSSSSLWTVTEVVSTESTDSSEYDSLAVDSTGNAYITWVDLTDYAGAGTDVDIFYKRFIGPPETPDLAFILPNPTDLSSINLDWNDVATASNYYVYRSNAYIWSINDLVPYITTSSSNFTDTLPAEGYYFYVVVAENVAGNSTHSNCQYVSYEVPHLQEYTIIASLLTAVTVIVILIFRKHKNK